MRNKVLIYRDYGSAHIDCLHQALLSYYQDKGVEVSFTDAKSIMEGSLEESVKALFMGGGAASPYMKKLNPLGNACIRDYVKKGGVYLGICAGAYYACKNVIFEQDVEALRIENQCGLDLVPAHAIGTLRKDYNLLPYSLTSFSSCVLEVYFKDEEPFPCFYQGGCYFENHESFALCFYDKTYLKPAMITRPYGQGRVILSGVHFEEDEVSLSKGLHSQACDYEKSLENLEKIKQGRCRRLELFNRVMSLV